MSLWRAAGPIRSNFTACELFVPVTTLSPVIYRAQFNFPSAALEGYALRPRAPRPCTLCSAQGQEPSNEWNPLLREAQGIAVQLVSEVTPFNLGLQRFLQLDGLLQKAVLERLELSRFNTSTIGWPPRRPTLPSA